MNYKAVNIITGENQLKKGSIVSYPNRGNYGNANYSGNCTGEIIKDLLTFYKPTKFVECFSGSGTGMDVAKALGITNSVHLDLNNGFDLLKDEIPTGFDFCFSHPPYWDIIKYANHQYQTTEDIQKSDISQIDSYEEFITKLNNINLKIYNSLLNNGRHAILIGDVKKKGKYYSTFKDLEFYGDIESHVIKVQHNTSSSKKNYSNYNFIPIAHEHLIILRKRSIWQLPVTVVEKVNKSIKESLLISWRELLQASLQHLGGTATLNEIYCLIHDSTKAQKNQYWKEKVRQTLQIHNNFESVERGVWKLSIA
ncbi:hypothetical protein [Gottfriedia solisilvae]|uniref:hypothetical protein n=1 Tax=Gottfriedia solisilvae TaxID=1516104 RepID=UPI003D2F412D